MISKHDDRLKTGVRNFDDVLSGGIPVGQLTVVSGSPGAGKTTLSQQIIFKNATPTSRALIFQTLSEPTAKTLRYTNKYDYFSAEKLNDGSVTFVDLGEILRADGLEKAIDALMDHVKKIKPEFVIIDSFKVFSDLSSDREAIRKFSYEVAINLMAWECTCFFVGEFSDEDIATNPLFSITDGIIKLQIRKENGEFQRFIQVVKMRGSDHSRDEHSFDITSHGIEIYAPKITIQRKLYSDLMIPGNGPHRAQLGISKLDSLLGEGIPYGFSCLVSGVAGTGKTLLLLEFIYRGASEFGEKGVFFSFEETAERIIANAKGMGWKIEEEINKGNIEIIFIEQPEIVVEKHLLMMQEKIKTMGAKRIAIDSSSVFMHKITDHQVAREKMFQLATLVQMAQGIGFFASDIPYGSDKISRFGVEETVVDGIILLTSKYNEKTFQRDRFLDVYKLRNTAHANGKHKMQISDNGIIIVPNAGSKIRSKKKVIRTRKKS